MSTDGFGVFPVKQHRKKKLRFLSSERDILEIEVGGPFPEDPYLLWSVFSYYKFIEIHHTYNWVNLNISSEL